MSIKERSDINERRTHLKHLFKTYFLPSFGDSIQPSRDALGPMVASLGREMVTRAHTMLSTTLYKRFTKYIGIKHSLSKVERYNWWMDICNPDYQGTNEFIRHYKQDWFQHLLPNRINMKDNIHSSIIMHINFRILSFYETIPLEDRKKQKIRMFTILPLKQGFTISHIPINNTTIKHILPYILREEKISKKKTKDNTDAWNRFLDLSSTSKCGMNRLSFGNYVSTDGGSISLLKKKAKPPEREEETDATTSNTSKKRKRVGKQPVKHNQYRDTTQSRVVGIDPGLRAFITASSGENKEDFFQVTGKEYYRRCGMTFASQTKTNMYNTRM